MGNSREEIVSKVLYVDSESEIFGGGQVSLLELLKGIDKTKYVPQVIISESGKLRDKIAELSIKCDVMPLSRISILQIHTIIGTIWKLYSFIKNENIAVVHVNNSRSMLYMAIVGLFIPVPIIWHVRVPKSDGLLDRFLAFKASVVITVSKSVKARFRWIKGDKVRVIYNGVDTERFSPKKTSKGNRHSILKIGEDIIIGTVGRLSPEKGIEYLISGMSEIVKEFPKAKLLIVGSGQKAYKISLQNRIKREGLSSHISIIDFLDDIHEVYQCFDVYCLSSLTEGFNRTLLEAMSIGLPVIATAVGGNREIIEDSVNGILVQACDPGALSAATIGLLKDRIKCAEMGKAGRKKIFEKFGIRRNSQLTQLIYEEVITENCD